MARASLHPIDVTLRPVSIASFAALVGATIATWLLAVGLTQIVGGACLPLHEGALVFRTEIATSTSAAPVERKIRATTIVSRDPFDSTMHVDVGATFDGGGVCPGSFRLVAAAIDDAAPERSIAILESESGSALDAPLVRVGSAVGGSRVISVGSSRVWLRGTKGACFIGATPPPRVASAESAQPSVAPVPGVRAVDDTHVLVDRSLRDALLEDPQTSMRALIIAPETTAGKTTGVRLMKVTPGSIFYALGMRAGDVVKSINGFDVSSPEKMLEAFATLKSAPSLQVELVRRGAPTTLSVEIR